MVTISRGTGNDQRKAFYERDADPLRGRWIALPVRIVWELVVLVLSKQGFVLWPYY